MTPAELSTLYHSDRARRIKRDAAEWYPIANAWAHETARAQKVTPELVVDLLAVLSPGVKWENNKQDVLGVLRWGKKHRPATWRVGREKAWALLEGYSFADLVTESSSPKVWNFRNNIADPRAAEYVTIDRWIGRFHGLPEGRWIRPNQYQVLATLYRAAASILGIVPNHLQAYIWLRTRNEYRFGPQQGDTVLKDPNRQSGSSPPLALAWAFGMTGFLIALIGLLLAPALIVVAMPFTLASFVALGRIKE